MPFALIPDDGTADERLSADDMATRREEEFLAAALREQAARSDKHRPTPGTCANCGEQCLPLAVYCDVDCRDDHERRLKPSAGR